MKAERIPRHGVNGWELVEYDHEPLRFVYEHPRHGRRVIDLRDGFWPALKRIAHDVAR